MISRFDETRRGLDLSLIHISFLPYCFFSSVLPSYYSSYAYFSLFFRGSVFQQPAQNIHAGVALSLIHISRFHNVLLTVAFRTNQTTRAHNRNTPGPRYQYPFRSLS